MDGSLKAEKSKQTTINLPHTLFLTTTSYYTLVRVPYADNVGVKIIYIDKDDGPPILLHHDLAGTHLDWIIRVRVSVF